MMTRQFYTYLEGGGWRYYPNLGTALKAVAEQDLSEDLLGKGPDHPLGPDTFWRNFIGPYERGETSSV